MRFSRTELRDIFLSVIILGFAFGGFRNFLEALVVVGISFLAHELIGHKLVAGRLGAAAEYRAWPLGLFLALVSSFFGVVFAAPGAVYFSPVVRDRFAFAVQRLGSREVGLIGLGGPAVNIILGALFLASGFLLELPLLLFAASISFFLGFFNLLPIEPLDGSKVFNWDWRIWLVAIALAGAGYFMIKFL